MKTFLFRLTIFYFACCFTYISALSAPARPGTYVANKEITLIPVELRFQHESINFVPDPNFPNEAETLGFSSIIADFAISEQFGFEFGSYGATVGHRGGFIAAGVGISHHFNLFSPYFGIRSSFFVGGGGGKNAIVTAKSGLMLRPAIEARLEFQQANIGIGYSYVTYPTGTVKGHQPYASLSLPTDIEFADQIEGKTVAHKKQSKLTKNRIRFAGSHKYYKSKGLLDDSGDPLPGDIRLMGAVFSRSIRQSDFVYHLELFGAYSGSVAGYMSVANGIGYEIPISNWMFINPTFLIGYAGGGGVDTEGGFIIEPKLVTWFPIGRTDISLYASVSKMWSQTGSFDVPTFELGVGTILDNIIAEGPTSYSRSFFIRSNRSLRDYKFSVSHQRYFSANTLRKGSKTQRLPNTDLLGLNINWYSNDWLFFNGGTYWAYGGDSGAYASGLVGGGLHFQMGAAYFEPQVNVGAGAGGGIPSGQALLYKLKASLGVNFSQKYSAFISASSLSFVGAEGFKTAEVGISRHFSQLDL